MRSRLLPCLLLVSGLLAAQSAVTPGNDNKPATTDPRDSPRSAIFGFLDACSEGDYRRAASFLALRRGQNGPELARALQNILDRKLHTDPGRLSSRPEGNLTDGLDAQYELLGTVRLGNRTVDLTLERITSEGLQVWVVSSGTVGLIPVLHDSLELSGLEQRLPPWLRERGPLETPWWVWIALALLVVVSLAFSRLAAKAAVRLLQPITRRTQTDFDDQFITSVVNPMRLLLALGAFRAGLYALPASVLLRTYLGRALTGLIYLAIAWVVMRLIDLAAARAVARMTSRHRLSAVSVVPLGRRTAKAAAIVIALLATLHSWGYNTTALLAGLGVGGLAIALAAQKTLENLFGGVAITSDKPVLVGDYCRYGDKFGTVEDIGLRSTRLRTLDRTVVTIPNATFSSLEIENFAQRDKFFFHPTLQLHKDTTPDQVRTVRENIRNLLLATDKVDPQPARVRMIGIGQWSLDLEVFAYVLTTDNDEFLLIQERLLLGILDIIAAAGTALAIPAHRNLPTRDGLIQPSGDKLQIE